MEDPEAYLTAFHTQMMLVGGSDVVKCKLFMSTLTGMALDWFINLPEGHITSFAQLSRLFIEQYLANRAPTPVSYDLFDVKQFLGRRYAHSLLGSTKLPQREGTRTGSAVTRQGGPRQGVELKEGEREVGH